MKITIGRRELIAAGNKAQLMPMTHEGWIYLANVALEELFPIFRFESIQTVNYRADGSIKNVVFSKMRKA